MTPDELRALADEATPGPWKIISDGTIFVAGHGYLVEATDDYDGYRLEWANNADARLAVLAPDLARLCAELGEALDALWNEAVGDSGGADAQVKAALAKLSELNSGAEHPPA